LADLVAQTAQHAAHHTPRNKTVRRVGFGLDAVAILVFVVIGRSAHQHGLGVGGSASTLWPFAVGLGCAWLVELTSRRDPSRLRGGVEITVVTVALGMMLRVVSGQGTALAFILVALGFLGATMALWRVVARVARRGLSQM
jgi:hypothetical protein